MDDRHFNLGKLQVMIRCQSWRETLKDGPLVIQKERPAVVTPGSGFFGWESNRVSVTSMIEGPSQLTDLEGKTIPYYKSG